MERGRLGVDERPSTVFVFEGLIGKLTRPITERTSLRLHQWGVALDQWQIDYRVCDYMKALASRHQVPIEVLTWHPEGFATVLHDRLWALDVPVRETKASVYEYASQWIATDPNVNTVYDVDHRFGYGFKAREFDIGRM
jgi:hypothetical protein